MEGRRAVVLYGSESGTAAELAARVWRACGARGLGGPLRAADEYPVRRLPRERLLLLVAATTGRGEAPANMCAFWRFLLRRALPPDSLRGLRFAVLALGDSSYPHFNFVGKKLHRRLVQLGAEPLLDVGLCDYQHDLGHDAVMIPWLEQLWLKLKEYYPDLNMDPNVDNRFIPRWKVSLLKTPDKFQMNGNKQDIYFRKDWEQTFLEQKELELIQNTRTTSEDHFQDVRLLSFKMANDTPFNYKPGDVFNVRPRNSQASIDDLFEIFRSHNLDIEPHYRLIVEEIQEDMPVPEFLREPLTMHEIAEQYWDLNYIPTQYVFSLLALVSEDKLERDKCIELCTPEGQEDLLNYCRRPRRTIIEVLQDFHRSASKLTIEILFELFSPIRPRSFSIASSCRSDDKTMDLLVASVKYYSKLMKPRMGLCSNWLNSLTSGDRIYGWIKNGTFSFPVDETTPCILIGPGTGLAPFRSLLLEREASGTARRDTLVMLFGCRYKERDYHCREDLERLEAAGKVTLVCAFSRDQEQKIYVQHKIVEHSELLWKLITEHNAMIFISGSSKNMPDNVKNAIVDVFQNTGKMDTLDAKELIKTMENDGKLQIEAW